MASELVSWQFFFQVYFLFFACSSYCFPHSLGSMLGRNDTDRLALLAFKAEITNDPFGTLSSWNESTHFCQWIGVTCGRRHQRVTVLDLDGRELTGRISPHVGNLSFLRELWLCNNRLSHTIPQELGRLRRLQKLVLFNNSLTGEIPVNISTAKSLTVVSFSFNSLVGRIPAQLGNCKLLLVLSLDGNNLTGTIPSEVLGVSSLLNLNLSQNHFTGPLPVEIGNLRNLVALDISENTFSNEIPSTISSCVGLIELYASGNNLQGELPSSLSDLKGIKVLDLSRNNFLGEIPHFLGNYISLRKLNLSFNDFEGMVPEMGIFKNATSFFIEGNKKLCGGIPELHLRDCNYKGSKSKRSTVILKLVILATCGLVGSLLVLMFLYHSWIKKRTKVPSFQILGNTFEKVLMFLYRPWIRKRTKVPSFQILGNTFDKVSYRDLFKATGGFSQSNLIGQGGFGSVYKGILDGKIVAVKVLNLEFGKASKSFIAECKALKNIKHRNLVKVVTACSSIDYQGKDFKALVYEFMANGSLDEWLHQNYESKYDDNEANELALVYELMANGSLEEWLHQNYENEDDDDHDDHDDHDDNDDDNATNKPILIKRLNLLQRLNIVIDVASAIDYLHNHCAEFIVHCDLKTSNVLLDNEMIGHVGDFGLARFFSESATSNSSTYQSSSIGISGSIGYVPPEYGMGNEVSRSGDVYSFGILLMETFTGKRPIDKLFFDSFSLRDFVKMALPVPEQVAGIVDPMLFQTIEETATAASTSTSVPVTIAPAGHNINFADNHRILECLISIFTIGIACSKEQPRDRMGIHDVVSQLHVIRNSYIGKSTSP